MNKKTKEEMLYILHAQRIPTSLYSHPVNNDPTPFPVNTQVKFLSFTEYTNCK